MQQAGVIFVKDSGVLEIISRNFDSRGADAQVDPRPSKELIEFK